MPKDDLTGVFFSLVKPYIHQETDLKLLHDALDFMRHAHEGVFRKGGEPYYTHPLQVASILASLKVGPNTLAAALLHDVVEDTSYTLKDISTLFNDDIAVLVDGVTKISKIGYNIDNSKENHQKLLLAMAKDIRVIVIKIADRLHNMRTLNFMDAEHQVRISNETIEIYAPLAHRLGMFKIKAEMEDLSLKYTHPEVFNEISKLLKQTEKARENKINYLINQIKSILEIDHLPQFPIKGRTKNIYSIYKKMTTNEKDFSDIYDVLAIRVIVDQLEQCYHVLGLIHANFVPLPKRFKDYIAVPKPNLYQSLHTTVLSRDETLFEVQIRTTEMDEIAENGIAAHWSYKENVAYSKEKEQFEIAAKLHWYAQLINEAKETESNDDKEFVETIKTDILEDNIYVFTPKGLIIELPTGSTPVDFAYRIHSDVGHKMTGAIVNNKMMPLDGTLVTGDIVNIKTNKNSLGPSEDWLKFVKSQHARHRIRAFLNQKNEESLKQTGKEELLAELESNKLTLSQITPEFITKNLLVHHVTSLESLYYEIGKDIISVKTIVNLLAPDKNQSQDNLSKQMEKTNRLLHIVSDTGVYVEGLDNPQIKLASCCNPIPGDKLIGYISKAAGIIAHLEGCPNLKTLDAKRFIDLEWLPKITRKYPCWLRILTNTHPNALNEVITAINSLGISIAEFKSNNTSSLETLIKVKVLLVNTTSLDLLIMNIKKIERVYLVERGTL